MNTEKVILAAQQFTAKARELQTVAAELGHLCGEAESTARYYARIDSRYEQERASKFPPIFTPEEAREAATADLMRIVGEAAQVIRQAQELAAWLPREHSDLARAVLDSEAVAPVE